MIKYVKIVLIIFILSSCKENKITVKQIKTIKLPTLNGSMQPFLFSSDDALVMSWTQKVNDSLYSLNYAELIDSVWTKPIEITNGDNWFVNWADFPAIAKKDENILVHYLQKSANSPYAYNIHLMLSTTDGDTWGNDFNLHTDSTKTEHGFVTLLPYKGDSFFATWLDGRNTTGGTHNEEHSSNGAMNIRTATILSTGDVVNDVLIDSKTCDCCQTSAAITPKGPIIVYRDRSDAEVRDIYISRLLDGSWTIPTPVHNDNWVINGCPVNGPKVASFKSTLVVAWFTAANNIPKVNIAFSKDSGANFTSPIQIDNGKPIGRVDVALLDENTALVSWMESTKNAAEIKVMKVTSDGVKENHLIVTELSAARSSGFPQLEVVNNQVYIAWNNVEDKQTNIKMKSIPITVFN